jgi:vancomycin resistance protein YoaR
MLYERIFEAPVSSVYNPSTFSATESAYGRTFDMDAARGMLERAEPGQNITIPLLRIPPEISQDELSAMLFRDVLGERSTSIAGTANRLNNVALAARFINETLLNPGETFSFNGLVGRRTEERGFLPAGAFVSGVLVDEIGGGICQTSSTLYVAALYANLTIIERKPHGLTVAYLPFGLDATIVWGQDDFRFRNNTDFPIRIETVTSGRTITARIIGTKLDDNYIVLVSREISSTPFSVVEREDPDLLPGERVVLTDGSTGRVVETFKQHHDGDGNLLREEFIVRSTYRMQDRIILIPVAEPEQPPPGDPGGDTGDSDDD